MFACAGSASADADADRAKIPEGAACGGPTRLTRTS
jgi:hypothetical protein